jgi:peptide deformylase
MALLPILTAPDPRLKVVSDPVGAVDEDLRRLMDDMRETMYAAPGIGLAAVQVGVPKRVIVVDTGEQGGQDEILYLINPEIVSTSDELWIYEEGCLSLPDQYADVSRPIRATVKFMDYDGEPQELSSRGLLASCIQHELDHLEGILFVDYLSALKRGIILKKLQKAQRQAAPSG